MDNKFIRIIRISFLLACVSFSLCNAYGMEEVPEKPSHIVKPKYSEELKWKEEESYSSKDSGSCPVIWNNKAEDEDFSSYVKSFAGRGYSPRSSASIVHVELNDRFPKEMEELTKFIEQKLQGEGILKKNSMPQIAFDSDSPYYFLANKQTGKYEIPTIYSGIEYQMISVNKFVFLSPTVTDGDSKVPVVNFFSVFSELQLIPDSLIDSMLSVLKIDDKIEEVVNRKREAMKWEKFQKNGVEIAHQYIRTFPFHALKAGLEAFNKEDITGPSGP